MSPTNPEYHKWFNAFDDYPPKSPGIYAIFISNPDGNDKILYYIGSSGNLRLRYAGHPVVCGIKNSRLNFHFLYLPLESKEESLIWESDFIGSQRPLLNVKMQKNG